MLWHKNGTPHWKTLFHTLAVALKKMPPKPTNILLLNETVINKIQTSKELENCKYYSWQMICITSFSLKICWKIDLWAFCSEMFDVILVGRKLSPIVDWTYSCFWVQGLGSSPSKNLKTLVPLMQTFQVMLR